MNDDNEDRGCERCGSDDTEWESCWCCLGEGYFDAHDEDPVNFAEGEYEEPCEECNGDGGYVVCHECARRAKKEAAA